MNLSDIGPYGVVAVILIIFAATGFFRGLISTTLAVVCLTLSGYSAYWMHQHADELISQWLKNPQPWLYGLTAVLAGFAVFVLSRYLLRFLIDPFNLSKTGQRIGYGFPAGVITFCIGIIFLWSSLAGVRYLGAAAELQQASFQIKNDHKQHQAWGLANQHIIPRFILAREWLDESSVGKLHSQSDPFHTSGKIKLGKILIYYHHKQSRIEMLKKHELSALLNDSVFLKLAHSDAIKKASSSDYPIGILSSKLMTEALEDATLSSKLDKLHSEDIIPALSS
ncbi:MAG: CvpA family protein [Akkermansiaceae bacterium]